MHGRMASFTHTGGLILNSTNLPQQVIYRKLRALAIDNIKPNSLQLLCVTFVATVAQTIIVFICFSLSAQMPDCSPPDVDSM